MLRTILFDLGNVLVHFSHDRMCDQIGAVLGRSGADVRRLLIDSGWMWDFERGRVTETELINRIEQEIAGPVDLGSLATAASDIFTLNEPMVPILDSLKSQGFRLVLLSNTSNWHVDWVRRSWPVLERFDELVLSYEVGAIKPESPVFEAALQAIRCRPDECFYTDDIEKYVLRGREYGLHAEIYTDAAALRGHLAEHGITV